MTTETNTLSGKQKHALNNFHGLPNGCWHCRWSGRVEYRSHLAEEFTLEQYEADMSAMIPCNCNLGRSLIQKAVIAHRCVPAQAAIDGMVHRADVAKQQADRYTRLCNEKVGK
jgi:hypothetical protein